MVIPFVPLRVVALIVGAVLLMLLSSGIGLGTEPDTGDATDVPKPAEQHHYFHNGVAWSPLVWGAADGGNRPQRQFASPTVHRFWFGAPYLQTMIAPPPRSYLARMMKLKENEILYRYHVPPGYDRWGWTHGVGYAPKEGGYSYGPNVYPARQAIVVGTPQHPQNSGEATGSYERLLNFDGPHASSNRDVKAAEHYIALGDGHFAKGEFTLALRQYRRASEAAPDFASAHFRQGIAYVAAGRSDFAATAFRKGLGLNPTWNESRFDLASLCGDSAAQYDEHASALRTRAESRTADSDAYFTLGVIHFLRNDDKAAQAYFDAVYHIGGKNAQFLDGFPAGTRGRAVAGNAEGG
jgi:Tetratricopeptide repeat